MGLTFKTFKGIKTYLFRLDYMEVNKLYALAVYGLGREEAPLDTTTIRTTNYYGTRVAKSYRCYYNGTHLVLGNLTKEAEDDFLPDWIDVATDGLILIWAKEGL